MKLKLLIGLAALALLTATCKKEFTSIPQLTFKSVSTTDVPHNGDITWTFQFTDAEGDLSGAVGILKTSNSPCTAAGFIDTTKYTMPVIPPSDDSKGTLTVYLPYDQLKTAPCNGADTVELATFRFWIYDAAGHVSDTATSPVITIHKQ